MLQQGYKELKTENKDLKMIIDLLVSESNDNTNKMESSQAARLLSGNADRFVTLKSFEKFKDSVNKDMPSVKAFKRKMACVNSASDASNIIFSGCNVHIRNGLHKTDSANGDGNITLG
jgi:hypothetical protein